MSDVFVMLSGFVIFSVISGEFKTTQYSAM